MFQLGKKQTVESSKKASTAAPIQKATWNQDYKRNQVGVDDMTLLSTLSNEAINTNLLKRFEKNIIYTYIGNVLISLNPFQNLPLYSQDQIESYIGRTRLECPPHLFAIAESAVSRLQKFNENQCVIISGESGAGKTEAAKKIMLYISAVTTSSSTTTHESATTTNLSTDNASSSSLNHVKDMIMATNPLLESFGNAKTLRNKNSSRFGKYLELLFHSTTHVPCGAKLRHYLLEKSRVVHQIQSERNYHIFYQMCQGASKMYPEFQFQGPEHFYYTSQSQCFKVEGIHDDQEYQEVLKAMKVMGLTAQEQKSIHQCIAAILWLGNLQFVQPTSATTSNPNNANTKEPEVQFKDPTLVSFLAHQLLQVNEQSLIQALTYRSIFTPNTQASSSSTTNERIRVPLSSNQCTMVRDALAKALYVRLFDWLVDRINQALVVTPSTLTNTTSASFMANSNPTSSVHSSIGILDIYGFEVFKENSFEQLCINFVNEKLQQIFIELTLKAEQEDYINEGIQWTPIAFFDNKIVCELIEEKRPPGVFALLCDVCARIHGETEKTDSFFHTQLNTLQHPRFQPRTNAFVIKHYAGDVTYQVQGMSEKNRDQLNKDVLESIKTSSFEFLHALFPEPLDWEQRQRPMMVSEKMKRSAQELSSALMACQPNYIRCIKPNESQQPNVYQSEMGLHQIQYLGLLQNVKVRRAGFASREPFALFLQRFYMLSPRTSYGGACTWPSNDLKKGCELILTHSGIATSQWQLGQSKVFIKHPETVFKLESLRDKYWHRMALKIQRAWRRYQHKRNVSAQTIQSFWRDIKGLNVYIQLRDYGHSVLNQQKERRRFSLISMRRFMGDYLDVAGTSGAFLRSIMKLDTKDLILFSSRMEVPVYGFLKTPKLSPRFVVLTPSYLYVIGTKKSESDPLQMVPTLMLQISTTRFQSLELSPYQDDFVILHLLNEKDVCLVCPFKTEFVSYLVYQFKLPLTFNAEITTTGKNNKKKRTIKFMKDSTISSTFVFKGDKVLVQPGAPPNSVSKPKCKKKPRAPSSTSTRVPRSSFSRPSPPSQVRSSKPITSPAPPSSFATTTTKPTTAMTPPMNSKVASSSSYSIPTSSTPMTSRPAPPAPRPRATGVPKYLVLYEYQGTTPNEPRFLANEVVEVIQEEASGWMLAKTSQGHQGWVPSSYLKKQE